MSKKAPLIAASALMLAASTTQAAVVVTDNGLTAPTIGVDDTGYTGATNQRFGWDSGENLGQSFTVVNAGTIGSIFLGYNAFEDGDTITLDLSVNGNSVATGLVLNGDDFSGTPAADSATTNFYWMEFDLSSESVAVNAGINTFLLEATANTGNSWALAPRYNNVASSYTGGQITAPSTNGDYAFAVTVVPEPSSIALIGIGGLFILRRRRQS